MRLGGLKLAAVALAGLVVTACASAAPDGKPINGGPRPPQGPGPAGTDFGFWNRDAEGAVDASFRVFVSTHYKIADEAKAKATLEKDGFTCVDGNHRVEGRPVPGLECNRLYKLNDDVHAWTVEFWPNEKAPRAHYTRTHIRDRMQTYDDKKHH